MRHAESLSAFKSQLETDLSSSPTPIDLSSLKHALSNLGNMCVHARVRACVYMCVRVCVHVHVCRCVCVWRWRECDVSETFVCAACEFLVSGTLCLFV